MENGWIKSSEMLPMAVCGESSNVLTADDAGIVRMLYFNGSNWCRPTGELYIPLSEVGEIVYWMPVPKPPMCMKGDNEMK